MVYLFQTSVKQHGGAERKEPHREFADLLVVRFCCVVVVLVARELLRQRFELVVVVFRVILRRIRTVQIVVKIHGGFLHVGGYAEE